MSNVYILDPEDKARPLARVRCRSESAELQDLLEKNPELLPGDQIRPEDPCRWLLVKREMPVSDPQTGSERWSVDFLFADQAGIPTLVECKRFADTRARREVVGQMLEYAANGAHYWDRDQLRTYLAEAAARQDLSLEEWVGSIAPECGASAEDFLGLVENNLREGQVRLVFFLEEAPQELKSIVDFLNRQMERSEVLLVEARLFKDNGRRMVLPSLFGFTEEARRVKRTVTAAAARTRHRDRASFMAAARGQLEEDEVSAIERLLDSLETAGCRLDYGGGCSAKLPSVCRRSFLTLGTTGWLTLNLGYLGPEDEAVAFRDALAELARKDLGFDVPPDFEKRFPTLAAPEWMPRTSEIERGLAALILEHRSDGSAS